MASVWRRLSSLVPTMLLGLDPLFWGAVVVIAVGQAVFWLIIRPAYLKAIPKNGG